MAGSVLGPARAPHPRSSGQAISRGPARHWRDRDPRRPLLLAGHIPGRLHARRRRRSGFLPVPHLSLRRPEPSFGNYPPLEPLPLRRLIFRRRHPSRIPLSHQPSGLRAAASQLSHPGDAVRLPFLSGRSVHVPMHSPQHTGAAQPLGRRGRRDRLRLLGPFHNPLRQP